MYWDVTSVKPEQHLMLKVKFADGLQGVVRFKPTHLTGVFEYTDPNQLITHFGAIQPNL